MSCFNIGVGASAAACSAARAASPVELRKPMESCLVYLLLQSFAGMQLPWHELLIFLFRFAVHAGICNASPGCAGNALPGHVKGCV